MSSRVAVIYTSATGNVHALAQAVADGAEAAGADVRRRHVEELASELLISQNQFWGRHRSIVSDEPVATLDDLEWAYGVAFGTPDPFRQCRRSAEAAHRPGRPPLAGRQACGQGRDDVHLVADRARRAGVDDGRAQHDPLPLGGW